MTGATASVRSPRRSTLARLCRTPLRDLVRGQVTGRLDREALLAEASLPQPLPQLVRQVVRRTWLFRLEKVAVAEELIAHFLDGLDAGRSAQELAASFGDRIQAARLIGRGKRRNRPLAYRAAVRSVQAAGGLLGLVVLLYGFAALRFFLATPNPAHDYLPDINAAALAAPDEARAWPDYRAALLALEPSPKITTNRKPRPGEPGWELIEGYLDRNRDVLARLRAAAAKPVFGYAVGFQIAPEDRALWPGIDPDPQPPEDQHLFTILLPYLAEIRPLAFLVLDDARQAAAAGDAERALEDLVTVIGFGGHMRQTEFIINDLVGMAVFAAGLEGVKELLHDYPDLLGDAQLAALAHGISAFSGGGTLRISLAGERMGFADFLQRAYTDNGAGDGRLTWYGLRLMHLLGQESPDMMVAAVGPALSSLGASRAELMEKFDALLTKMYDDADQPLWKRGVPPVDREVARMKCSPLQSARYLPIVLLMPALSKPMVKAEVTTQLRDAALVVIALNLHKRRFGDWPSDLGELAPQFLPAVPPDRFDGQPLRYLVREGEPILYSVGTDRDDDGGRRPLGGSAMQWLPREDLDRAAVVPGQARRHVADGDWVLWPPRAVEPMEELGPGHDPYPIYGF